MKSVRIPSEDPYRKVLIEYFNLILGRSAASEEFWTSSVKNQIMLSFQKALTPEELDGSYNLQSNWENDDFVQLFRRIQEVTAVELTPETEKELKQNPRSIQLLDADIAQIKVKVKHLGLIDESEAKSLYYQFRNASGAQADRLWELVNKKFTLAVASRTHSEKTIFLWATVLFDQGRKPIITIDSKEHLEILKERRRSLQSAKEKFKACVVLNSRFHAAWFEWGNILIEIGKRKEDWEDRTLLFKEAGSFILFFSVFSYVLRVRGEIRSSHFDK